MDLNVIRPTTESGTPKSLGPKKWPLLILVVVAVLVVAGYQVWQKTVINSRLGKIPATLILPENQKIKPVSVAPSNEFTLRSNESLDTQGLGYIVNKSQKETRKQIFDEITAKKWVFSDGSKEIEGGVIYKFTDGQKYYFIKLTGGLEPEQNGTFQTQVLITTVNR